MTHLRRLLHPVSCPHHDGADAAAFDSRADPAAASFVWHTRPDGAVDLPPAGAAMADADDPDEDDVDMLQVNRNMTLVVPLPKWYGPYR